MRNFGIKNLVQYNYPCGLNDNVKQLGNVSKLIGHGLDKRKFKKILKSHNKISY